MSATRGSVRQLRDAPPGLSSEEAQRRRARGQGNTVNMPTTRSYVQIITENVFTFINMSLLGLGVALALLGRVGDALISTGVISLNIVVSLVQEIRAKRTLDHIALLSRPTATVLRDGSERMLPPEELALGDVLRVGPGDQFVVDGRWLSETPITVDESLLTGEADPIPKIQGSEVYSGSFCMAGDGYYVAERVGAQNLVNQLTASARAFRRTLTPLQREIHLVVRLALLIVVYMEFLLTVTSLTQRINLADSVENSTIVAGLIPNGLFLSIAVTYALGAVRILRFGALVQQSNAIESLSHVDVLCFDKTGTLTTNQLSVEAIYPLAGTSAEMETLLGALAANVTGGNKTTDAIGQRWPAEACPVAGVIPFSSARRWSAVAFDERSGLPVSLRGVVALGAPEALLPYLAGERERLSQEIAERSEPLTRQGLRVVLLAHTTTSQSLADRGDASMLPAMLRPLGLLSLRDELRPEARETLTAFAKAGVRPKIISGDHAKTVAALARQAGLPEDAVVVEGARLDDLDDVALGSLAESATVFGRITPQQKERIIQALRMRGHYVAMIGDGVNDVRSLKKADLGIAMRSGSQATRGVADIVLMRDSFAALAPAAQEGQRILNGMQDILRLFLTRITSVGLVIVSALVVGLFPLELRQGSLVTLLSVGIPTILLAVWARPGPVPSGALVRRLLQFVLPPALLTSVLGVSLYFGVYALWANLALAQSALTAFLVFNGLLLVIFVEPPTEWWVGASKLSGDWRPTLMAVGLMLCFVIISAFPALRGFFALSALTWPQGYVLVAVATALWLFLVRLVWRSYALTRYLGIESAPAVTSAGDRDGSAPPSDGAATRRSG
ncbi:MAG TPA: HAD-IC family P-type ATPase [Ktedonobacterales bacterium]|nr:HAD-IC family P-type ATPase [Ktedonobacterales bacterium]